MTGPVQVIRVGGPRATGTAVDVGGGGAAAPVQVVGRTSLAGLADTAGFATAPADTPLVLRKGADGVFRPEPAPAVAAGWGDQVRFEPGPPTATDDAPDGALWVDLHTSRIYEHRSTP